MSWASRRRASFTFGIILFFTLLLGVPLAYWYLSIPETCNDGIQNGGETAIDKGGDCRLIDERLLSPHAILWSRAFPVRDGSYNAIAYIENPNENAGVMQAAYRFKLYDARNIIVAEREGAAAILPGTVTPIFEGAINTGNRTVARAYLEFTAPLVWERVYDPTLSLTVESKRIDDAAKAPRLTAVVRNLSVVDMRDVQLVAVVFDTAGNAFAGSSTVIPILEDGERKEVVFTWPDPFLYVPGRIDVLPILEPSTKRP